MMGKTMDYLIAGLRRFGPIRTARVSSAQASGYAKQYAYWGAVRYQIRLTRDGKPANMPLERASSDRRSERLAQADLERLCETERRIPCQRIGRLDRETAAEVLAAVMPRWTARAGGLAYLGSVGEAVALALREQQRGAVRALRNLGDAIVAGARAASVASRPLDLEPPKSRWSPGWCGDVDPGVRRMELVVREVERPEVASVADDVTVRKVDLD